MIKYRVWVTEEIKTVYEVEAKRASTAISMVKSQKNAFNSHCTVEKHYRTERIKEENKDE